jgi:hypothetical protein
MMIRSPAVIMSGRVYVFGGWTAFILSRSFSVFDLSGNNWGFQVQVLEPTGLLWSAAVTMRYPGYPLDSAFVATNQPPSFWIAHASP